MAVEEWLRRAEDSSDSFKKFKQNLKQEYGHEFNNIEATRFLKYQLLFHKPENERTRRAAKHLMHQTPNTDKGLVYDELENLNRRTRNNYTNILEVFEPKFSLEEDSRVSPGKLFDYAIQIYLGRAEYDEERIDKFLQDEEIKKAYHECYNSVKKYVKRNKISAEFREKLDIALEVFHESRPLPAEIYKAAEDGISVKY